MFQIFKRLSITLLAGMMLAPFGTAHAARSAVHSSQTASTIDPAALRIPDTTFAPAVLNPQADSVLTTATLDTGKFFTYFHPNGYAALGRVNGYYEAAGWTPTGSDPIIFRYLASIYPSSQAASTAFDALTTFFTGTLRATFGACGSETHVAATCNDARVGFSNGTDLYFREVQVGVCVSEIANEVSTQAESDANEPQIAATQDAMTVAAVTAMSKMCSAAPAVAQQPTLSINGMGVYHKVKGKVKLTSVLKLNEGGLFIASYVATNATGITPSAVIDFLKGGKTVAHADMLPAKLSDGTPYFYTAGKFAKTKFVGHLTARVTITIGTVTDVRSIQFTVKKGK